MNLILLPPPPSNPSGINEKYLLPGYLSNLVNWFSGLVRPVSLLTFLPESHSNRGDLQSLLREVQNAAPCEIELIANLRSVDSEFIEGELLDICHRLTLRIGAEEETLLKEVMTKLANRRFLHRSTPLKLKWWIDRPQGVSHLRQLYTGLFSALALEDVGPTAFTLSPELRLDSPDSPLPFTLDTNFPECMLYINALTVNFDGQILPCAQYQGTVNAPELGSLFTETPSSLIYRKGLHNEEQRDWNLCKTCSLPARCYWKSDYNAHLEELFEAGKKAEEESQVNGERPSILRKTVPGSNAESLETFSQQINLWKQSNPQ